MHSKTARVSVGVFRAFVRVLSCVEAKAKKMEKLPEKDKELYQTIRDYASTTWSVDDKEEQKLIIKTRFMTKQTVAEQIELAADSVDPVLHNLPSELDNADIVRYIVTLEIPTKARQLQNGVRKVHLDHIVNVCGIRFADMRFNASDSTCVISILINSSNLHLKSATLPTTVAVVSERAPVRKLALRKVGQAIDTVGMAVVRSMSNYLFGSAYVEEFENGRKSAVELGEEIGNRTGKSGKRAFAGADTLDKDILPFSEPTETNKGDITLPPSPKKTCVS